MPRLAVAQTVCQVGDVAANLDQAQDLVAQAHRQRADFDIAGQDEDIDAAVTSAESALPLTTLVTIPAFMGLALFLRSARSRLRPALLWIGSLVGTGLMTAIVMTGHIGMYDLLYTRGRMHSTSGVGILFTAVYCVLVAALIAVLTVWAGRAVQQKRSS